MNDIFKKPVSLLLLLTLTLAGYHLTNFPYRGKLHRPWLGWAKFSLDWGTELRSFNVPQILHHLRIDEACRVFGAPGYILRYQVGQYPYDMFSSGTTKVLDLYGRDQVALQYPSAIARVNAFARESDSFVREMAEKGVTVIPVVPPTHLSIERGRFGTKLPPPVANWQSAESSNEDSRGVYNAMIVRPETFPVDLYQYFSDFKQQHPEADLFIPSDDHWSSLGIALSAAAVVEHLRKRGWNTPTPLIRAKGESFLSYQYQLLGYLQLPTWYLSRRPAFQWQQPLFALQSEPSSDTNSADHSRVIVAGTSFSASLADRGLDLGSILGQHLRRQVVVKYLDGGDTSGGLGLFAAEGFHFRRGDLLIWEYPLISVWLNRNKRPLPHFPVN